MVGAVETHRDAEIERAGDGPDDREHLIAERAGGRRYTCRGRLAAFGLIAGLVLLVADHRTPTVERVTDPDVRWIDPPRRVLVRHDDGAWYTGFQNGWSRSGGVWRASVRYTVRPGEQYDRAVPADRVEVVDE